jgi:hypothetical protein
MTFTPGNIWSGDRTGLAVLTNPTCLACKKGHLKRTYPIEYQHVHYPDVEHAFQQLKYTNGWPDMASLMTLMVALIQVKLETYPGITETIQQSGGVAFLRQCSHRVNGGRWEGVGEQSPFIFCLITAYELVIA